ncbi:MAG: J domain-containing protein [Calditrichaeota bacterium]|nr:MAG: J domain-containing protein [Calditrichota bacterium]
MNPNVDYYAILGVSETATVEEIKLAYRRLAKEYHPDSQGGNKEAEERFKGISEAYAVLSNEKKRREYDLLRRSRLGGSGEGFHFGGGHPGSYQVNFGENLFENMQDIFGDLFNRFGGRETAPEGGYGGRMNPEDLFTGRAGTASRGADLESTVTIPFNLAVNGGETIITTRMGKRVKLKIPPGIEEGKKIRLRGHGAPSPNGGEPGDLYLIVKVTPHPEFERKGADIYSRIYLNIAEAVLGTEVQVKTVSGKHVKLKIPPGTGSGKIFRLPQLGVKTASGAGDHYVRVEIDVPVGLSRTQKREFEAWAKKIGLIN